MSHLSSGRSTHQVLHSFAKLTDLEAKLVVPDKTLFPGLPTNAEVHHGFAEDHKKTANKVLAEVRNLMAEHSSTKVVLVRPSPLRKKGSTRSGCHTDSFRGGIRRSAIRSAEPSQNSIHSS
jgi:hypothetical protein